jgi:hypothetical protein
MGVLAQGFARWSDAELGFNENGRNSTELVRSALASITASNRRKWLVLVVCFRTVGSVWHQAAGRRTQAREWD